MFSSPCFCPQHSLLADVLAARAAIKRETHKEIEGLASTVHTCTNAHSNNTGIPSIYTHTHTCTQVSIHSADFSFWPTIAARLGSAQQQQNSALCSYSSTSPCFCLTTPLQYTHTYTHFNHNHCTSFPSKSLSFLLLIMVVGPFELFKAAQAGRKRWSVCRGRVKDSGRETGKRGADR